jgi:adhesin transport system membrane fusion protein
MTKPKTSSTSLSTLRGWTLAPKNDDDALEFETRTPRVVIAATVIGLAAFLFWASVAELDQVTRAQGSVIASSRSQVMQAVDGGVLQELLVKEGDLVEAGQLVARLDRTKLEASYLEARAKAVALGINVTRLQAEVLDRPLVFSPESQLYPQFRENQRALFQKRRSAIQQEISALEAMLSLAKQELEMTEPLLKTGDVSRSDVLRLQRQVADLNAQITNRRNKYFQDAQAELNKAEEELTSVLQIVAQRKEQLDATEFKSPMRGTVKNIRITTRGGVLRAGEELMQIVPLDDDLVIEAKVRPADIGFLKTGLDAAVKVDAFDYTIYGGLDGKVSYISPDTLREESPRPGQEPEYYRVWIKVEDIVFSKRQNETLEIQPGMTATVEIKTGSNTVLRYISKPVIKTISESMGER